MSVRTVANFLKNYRLVVMNQIAFIRLEILPDADEADLIRHTFRY